MKWVACYEMQSDSIAYNNILLLVRGGRIRFSPDRLLPDRSRLVSEVRLPSSAGMDPDRTDSGASHLDEYDLLWLSCKLISVFFNFKTLEGQPAVLKQNQKSKACDFNKDTLLT